MTMLSINTNVAALNASQSSYSVNKSMETSMARLSSGQRINSGADDAAGLFITKRMATEIQGLNQAVRNAADSQAFLMTAEGAHEEIHTILLRIRELAVQASNDTYDTQDRYALRAEMVDLQAEIDLEPGAVQLDAGNAMYEAPALGFGCCRRSTFSLSMA